MKTPWPTQQHAYPRRAFRMMNPGQQARLALAIIVTTLVFCLLAVGNSVAAYGSLIDAALSTAPMQLADDLQNQTHHYLRITSALAIGYALAVLAISVIFVNRMTGPVVALERHVIALKSGDYSSRIGLRSGRSIYSGVAHQLNELATRLGSETSQREGLRRRRKLIA
jgi:signal transduction histidine kinase